ncbi:MAG: hypothetical protein ACYDA8_16605 [Deferrisomatales bacterium]
MRRTMVLLLLLALLAPPLARAAESGARATPAYREAYGAPPALEPGLTCLAAVVYLPGIGVSGGAAKLSALPLFSVNPDRVAHEAARVLVQGHPVAVRLFAVPRLFPADSRLDGLDLANGIATVRVTPGAGATHPLAGAALAATLGQFEGIRGARLALAGGPPADLAPPAKAAFEPPPPPRLLDVVSSVHPGEEPEEVNALFDRPLDVTAFSLRLADGGALPGKTYTSMFDMAVVVRPDDPRLLREGLPLRLSWKVKDRVGREAAGERAVELRIYRHPK